MLKGCLCAYRPQEITFVRRDARLGRELARETGCSLSGSVFDCVRDARFVILAVKPQAYQELLPQVRDAMDRDHIILSLAPNYTIDMLKKELGEDARIIRLMPNTPAAVGEGMTGFACSEDSFSEEEMEQVRSFLNSFGRAEEVPEKLMSAVTAASGSSPAFVYMMIEAMADGVVACGMPRAQAYRFVAQTVLGSARMVLETGRHPGQLKDEVCSPGGTTIAAVARLEEGGFRSCLIEAARMVDARCKNM